ncbi:MAG: efflux RND transporter periplasmic adaptor subunit [Planctomycetes bacterium]|nr:efflux RND transporter periplasmic adaptor subunit [Planctomycetota bacterium]
MKYSSLLGRVGTAHQRLQVNCRPVVCSAHPTYLILGALLVSGLAGCGTSEAKQAAVKGAKGGGSRPSALVSLATVEKRSIHPRVVVVGTVTPRAVSVVASGANGIVAEFKVERGQFVKKGDVLSVLRNKTTDLELGEAIAVLREREQKWKEMQKSRDEDIIEAQARMRAAAAVHKNAAQKLKRTQELAAQNAVNADELDDAIERAKAAEQAFLAAQANNDRVKAGPRIEQREQARFGFEAQKVHVAWLEAEKEKRTTKAPFDGYIVQDHTFVGMWLSKGDPIVTLNYLDTVDVVVNVDQRDLHNIQIGRQAEIRFPGHELTRIQTTDNREIVGVVRNETSQSIELVTGYVDQDERASRIFTIPRSEIFKLEKIPWQGEIVSIVPKSEWESGSRSFPVEVRVRNYFDTISSSNNESMQKQLVPILKEGMMAEVIFEGPPLEALLVPKDALVRTTRGINIFVFTPVDNKQGNLGRTVQVPVELGLSEGEWIQVHPKSDAADSSIPFGPGTKVVVEGGERLQPVQEGVQPVSRSSSSRG